MIAYFNRIVLRRNCLKFSFIIGILLLLVKYQAHAQYPSGFLETDVSSWSAPSSMAFDTQGHMFVTELVGKLYKYENGQKTLLLDITEEVAQYGDLGLLGMVLDPNFLHDGYIYLFYTVDRHHLLNFGTPQYSASTSQQGATIARVTRYTLSVAGDFNFVVPNSRLVLIGESKSTGIPITGLLHAGGDMAFSAD